MRRPSLYLFLASLIVTSSLCGDEALKAAKTLQPFVDQHHIAGAVVLVADAKNILAAESIGMMDIETPRAKSDLGEHRFHNPEEKTNGRDPELQEAGKVAKEIIG